MFLSTVARRSILPLVLVLFNLVPVAPATAATVAAAGMAPLSAGTIYSTLKRKKLKADLAMGTNAYTQSFAAQITSYPIDLNVRFGADKTPNTVRLRIAVNGVEVFDHTYADLLETPVGTTFELRQFPRKILNGDIVSFSIAPSAIVTRIEAVEVADDLTAPAGKLADGQVLLGHFAMTGAVAPDPSAFETVVPDPAIFRSNMIDPGVGIGGKGGFDFYFTQQFISLQTGVPTELGVSMGNQSGKPYDCDLTITINNKQVFRSVLNVFNAPGTPLTVFSLRGFTDTIKAGDVVSFRVAPKATSGPGGNIGFYVSTNPRPGIQQNRAADGGPAVSAKFYMKK